MKKGFTLVELLTVIAILALVALIGSPIIVNIMESSKEKAYLIEANNIADELKNLMLRENVSLNGTYTKEEVKAMLDMDIKGEKIIVTMINDSPKVTMIKDGKYYSSKGIAIYGLSWDGNDNYKRLMDAVGMEANVGTDGNIVVNDFDNAQIYNEIKDVIEDGNYFVKIPKFYIKKVVDQTGTNNKWEWYISKVKIDENYYLPACFMDETNNKELDYILVGKYDASLDENKLSSKKDVVPLTTTSMEDFRQYALNNNINGVKGYQLIDIHTIDALQVLFYVEFATLNSQKIMKGASNGKNPWESNHKVISKTENTITITSGTGSFYRVGQLINIATASAGIGIIVSNLKITAINGDTLSYEITPFSTGSVANIAANNIIYNVANINGLTDNVMASSGSIVSNSDGKYPMKYRGVENLYGNVTQYIDGISFDCSTRKIYVNNNANTYTSNKKTDDYILINYTTPTGNNSYISKMGYDRDNPFIQIPIAYDGNATTKYGDFYYQTGSSGMTVLEYGGISGGNDYVGISYFDIRKKSNAGQISHSTRIMKTPIE